MSDPGKFLAEIRGGPVIVKLHSGIEYHGKLLSIDSFMNVVLHESSEIVNNQVANRYNDTFIRGSNGEYERRSDEIEPLLTSVIH